MISPWPRAAAWRPETRWSASREFMEEDAGKSLHHGFPESDRQTMLDYNRSGAAHRDRDGAGPAVRGRRGELFRSPARGAGRDWSQRREHGGRQLALRRQRVVAAGGSVAFGAKAEVKNVNSFRFLQKALEFEIDRQRGILESGGRVEQETRQWDSDTGTTQSMRSKEGAHDYRYFPEPDLPPLRIDEAWIARVRKPCRNCRRRAWRASWPRTA